MMPSGARVKPRESMDRTSKGRNCSGQLGPKIKDVLSMIESQSWQWLTSKDWGNNLWKNGDIFFYSSDFKEYIFTKAVIEIR